MTWHTSCKAKSNSITVEIGKLFKKSPDSRHTYRFSILKFSIFHVTFQHASNEMQLKVLCHFMMNINFILRNILLYFCTVLLDVSIKYCIKCSKVFIIIDLGIQCESTVWTHSVKFVMDTDRSIKPRNLYRK